MHTKPRRWPVMKAPKHSATVHFLYSNQSQELAELSFGGAGGRERLARGSSVGSSSPAVFPGGRPDSARLRWCTGGPHSPPGLHTGAENRLNSSKSFFKFFFF